MRRKIFLACVVILLVTLCFALPAFAHPGRTDSYGGHVDRSTGEYHYHHGYPAHKHPGGVCPYNNNNIFSPDDSTTDDDDDFEFIFTDGSPDKVVEEDEENKEDPIDIINAVFGTLFLSVVLVPIAVYLVSKIVENVKENGIAFGAIESIFYIAGFILDAWIMVVSIMNLWEF